MEYALQPTESNPLDALKHQTWELHKALEKRLAFPDSYTSKTAYSRVLILFYVFQRQLDAYTQEYQSQVATQLALPQRNRLPLIEQDMRQLGIPTVSVENFSRLQLRSLDEFYGCLYVDQGSTLGGHIIQAAMLKMHGEAVLQWTHYLNPYGSQMLPMWQSFRSALLEEIASGDVMIDGVISGAGRTFEYLLDTAQQLGFEYKL